jgi:hypothetical protein
MKERILRASWSFDEPDCISDELASILAEELSKEIDAQIIKELLCYDKCDMVGKLREILPPETTDSWDITNSGFDDIDSDMFA